MSKYISIGMTLWGALLSLYVLTVLYVAATTRGLNPSDCVMLAVLTTGILFFVAGRSWFRPNARRVVRYAVIGGLIGITLAVFPGSLILALFVEGNVAPAIYGALVTIPLSYVTGVIIGALVGRRRVAHMAPSTV